MVSLQKIPRNATVFLFFLAEVFTFEACCSSLMNIDLYILGTFGLLCLFVMYKSPWFVLRYMSLFFMSIANLIGVYICENESFFLTELLIDTHHVGSLGLISLGWGLFISILYVLELSVPLCQKKSIEAYHERGYGQPDFDLFSSIVTIFFAVGLLLMWIHLWDHPFFLENIDRFGYKKIYLQGYWHYIDRFLSYGCIVVLFLAIRKKFFVYLFLLFAMCLFEFWKGEKFGFFFNLFCCACILFSINMQIRKSNKNLLFLGKMAFIGALLLLVTLGHRVALFQDNNIARHKQDFFQRVAQQGQLWWRIYESEENKGLHLDELGDEFRVFFLLEPENDAAYNHGIYKIMRKVTTGETFSNKISTGSTYSTSTHASVYYYFKDFGIIAWAVASAFFYWGIMRFFLHVINTNYTIDFLIGYKLLMAADGVIGSSNIGAVFSLKMIIALLLLICVSSLRQKYRFVWRYKFCSKLRWGNIK